MSETDVGSDERATQQLAGRLLVATPALTDPNFFRTTILLLEHALDDGALGLVLNRPSETSLGDLLPDWMPLATEPGWVHLGGPVSPNSAICLAALRGELLGQVPPGVFAALPAGREPSGLQLGTVDLDADPSLVSAAVTGLRVFAGYSGWGAGQLESEIDEGAWYVLNALPRDAFASAPERLWRDVLARQEGPLSLVATMPSDPSLN